MARQKDIAGRLDYRYGARRALMQIVIIDDEAFRPAFTGIT